MVKSRNNFFGVQIERAFLGIFRGFILKTNTIDYKLSLFKLLAVDIKIKNVHY